MSFIKESYLAYKKVYEVKETSDHEISMARGELEAIADKATQLASMLQGKSDEGNPLEAWVQSKITKAKDYITSVSDYMMHDPGTNESKLIENDLMGTLTDTQLANIKKAWANKTMKDVTPGIKAMLAKMDMPTKVAVKHAGINVLSDLVYEEAELQEKPSRKKHVVFKLGDKLVAKDFRGYNDDEIAKSIDDFLKQNSKSIVVQQSPIQSVTESHFSMGQNVIFKGPKNPITPIKAQIIKLEPPYTGAYYQIKKADGETTYASPDQLELDEDLEEGKMSQIYTMDQDGASIEDIAKALKIRASTVRAILGEEVIEEVILESFTDVQIAQLKKEFEPLKGKQISTARANQLSNILNKLDDGSLDKLKNALIPFVSALAAVKVTLRKMRGVKITKVTVPGLENMAEVHAKGYTVKYKMKKDDKLISQMFYVDKDLAIKFLLDVKKDGGNGIITANEQVEEEIKVDKPAIVKSLQDRMKKVQSEPDSTDKKNMLLYIQSKIKMLQSKNEEKLEEGAKRYKEMSNVGSSKYVVSFHDGIKKHNDGSDFFDIQIFKNKEEKNKFIIGLEVKGYRPVKIGEEVKDLQDACWTGYKQVGLKKKGKKMVPNCVPEETLREQKFKKMFGEFKKEYNKKRGV